MSEAAREEASGIIAERLIATEFFRRAKHVGCYVASGAEVDTAIIIEMVWARNKSCYLPALIPAHQNRLWFAPFSPNTTLSTNQYGIYEPVEARRNRVLPQRLDLVIVPLVAFDRNGTRIGMGGGYYDRTFAFRRVRHIWLKPALIGLAFECQKTARIPTNNWDVRLDAVITEQTMYAPKPGLTR